ncbi:hypothetical protein [Pseudonocardia sp. GCM10023141]|uniref:hypothetical protein n=1 Tax=Pseudonocardia sp. GCM10023141 TaxID=3252653 RepID=UPI003623C4D2
MLQVVQGRSALAAGVAMLPLFVPLVVLGPVAGRFAARCGPRVPMLVAAALGAPSAAALVFVTPEQGSLLLGTALLGLGCAAGRFTAPVVAAGVQAVPGDRAGLAAGLITTARQAGTALGVALFGAVAGAPADAAGFTAGLHVVGAIGGAAWALAFLLSAIGVPPATRR